MPVDNDLYNRPGDIWWDEHQPLNTIRTALNPSRLEYFARTFQSAGVDPVGKVAVDIGCGGGLLAEEVARQGVTVIGIDPSAGSLATARAHAAAAGLDIDYRAGTGEHLPLDDAAADIAYCVDVLEHVQDLDAVIGETARVLKPGGMFLYDTINRTRLSRLVMIKLCQEWSATAWMPPDLHDWTQFIPPADLIATLSRNGLQNEDMVGMAPGVPPPQMIRRMRQLKKGKLSAGDFGRKVRFVLTKDTRILYIGHATRVG